MNGTQPGSQLRYQATQLSSTRQAHQITQWLPAVKRQARYVSDRLQADDMMDDLVQAGLSGLLEALQRYQPDTGVAFWGYALPRIRGAMIDEIRRQDWRPRGIGKMAGNISQVMVRLEQSLGRLPVEREIAEAMGMSLADYQHCLNDIHMGQLEVLPQESDEPASDIGCESVVSRRETEAKVTVAVSQLAVRERQLLSMYYGQELTMQEIASGLGITEARVSQIHKQCLLKLRILLNPVEDASC